MLSYTLIGRFSLKRLIVVGLVAAVIGALLGLIMAVLFYHKSWAWVGYIAAGSVAMFVLISIDNMTRSPSNTPGDWDPM
jgi:hypothetical protein